MLRCLWGHDTVDNSDLMEKVWVFRHRHFVDRFGWEALRKADLREIDEYDTAKAVHLILTDKNEVLGYSRLLPTSEPHLLSHVYPQLMGNLDWPKGETIYEWTRCVAETGDRRIGGVPVSHMLMTGVMEYCLMAGMSSLIVETHPKLVNLLVTTGWNVTPLSSPTEINGHPVVPIDARPSPRGLLQHHDMYSISGSVVDIEGSSGAPIGIARPLKLLPFLEGHHPVRLEQKAAG